MAGKQGGASLALLLGVVLALGAAGLPLDPPEGSWLSLSRAGRGEKPPVWFSHRLHDQRRVACERCHHDYQGRRNLWRQGQPVQKCGSCHGPLPRAGRPDLKEAFHRQCKGCHQRLRQERRPGGPVQCAGCHRRG